MDTKVVLEIAEMNFVVPNKLDNDMELFQINVLNIKILLMNLFFSDLTEKVFLQFTRISHNQFELKSST